MLTALEVFSDRSSAPLLPLTGDYAGGDSIQIKSIEGLGPIKATVNTAQLGSGVGKSFSGSTIGDRNIVITVGLNPNWAVKSMASLRQELYSYFMTQQKTKLIFHSTHLPTVSIEGIVEA